MSVPMTKAEPVPADVLPPARGTVEVDFCRGPSGAFLAIDNLVVAGDCTGGGRTIQSFAVDRGQILRALGLDTHLQKAGQAGPG